MKIPTLLCVSALAATEVLAQQWTDIWVGSPQLARYFPPAAYTDPKGYFRDTTIRQTLHLTLAAPSIRVKLSNEFGTSPLVITTSSVASTAGDQTGSDGIDTTTLHALTFGGSASVTIPAGGTVVSDTVNLATKASQELTVSLYLATGQTSKPLTDHDVSHTTSWLAKGDQTKSATLTSGTSLSHWYYVTEIQGDLPTTDGALICIGDSITDGTGSTMNGNNRWVDDLFQRTQANAATQNIAVLNAGIGGNHLVTTPGNGPTAVDRISSIIAQPGVKYVTILDGVNDIGHTATTAAAQNALYTQMVSALEQIINTVHAAGLPIFGATLTPSFDDPPYSGAASTYANPQRAATRNKLNQWILTQGKFDYVVDYAAAVGNKSDENQYQTRYAYTNYIHPNVAGHQAMANAWDLSVFAKFANGV